MSHIDAVFNLGVDDAWQFTTFYGNPIIANREHSWLLLKQLSLKMNPPWMYIGDFNEITRAKEKMGNAPRRERQMVEFREALDFYGFHDLGYVGAPFTWCNNQYEGEVTWIMLDRGVATTPWSQMLPPVQVHHISGSLSDHCPLWICSDDENARFYRKGKPFHFKAVWMKDAMCERVVKNAWERQALDNPMEKLVRKVDICRSSL